MYFNDIKYILIDLKLFKIDLLLYETITYLIICVGSMLVSYAIWCHEQNGLLSKVGYSIENKVFYIIVYC